MKRTFAITLTVAMIGSLMFMGFAGTAAAQNVDPDDFGFDIDFGDQDTGDAAAETNVNVDQNNNNAQIGVSEATSGDAIAVSDGGAGGGAVATGDHYKNGAEQLASPADAGSATAGSFAFSEVNQAQDVAQQNNADVSNVTTTADTSADQSVDSEIGDDVDISIDFGDFDD
ncbi:hypothetical protein [Natronolimnobius baerhuensis]|nr:hypothetical protein [Natronolimnobius baerhuensis]